jgi:hypothetical protein
MNYEVQTYDTTDNTVYYETVEDAMSGEDARDVIAEKHPNRKVIAVQCSGSNEPGQKGSIY